MHARVIPKEQLTAYQRWELGSLTHEPAQPRREEPAAPDLNELRRAAEQQGFQAGYAQGQLAAGAHVERLEALLQSARQSLAEMERDVAGALLDLAVDLARQVLRGELTARRDALLPVVREAIHAVPETVQSPKLVLHPSDADTVRAHVGDELKLGGWKIVEDHLIEPGGCKVMALNCEIDATLATRWKRVIATLGSSDAWDAD
jgi:flagellar assembly protein FliH